MDERIDRAVGAYPLSIATSLALEGAFGTHPDPPNNKKKLSDYDELWVNVRTLFRNYYNSIGHENYNRFRMEKHKSMFDQELNMFEDVVFQLTNGKTSVKYFFSEYKNVERLFWKPLMRENTTDNQIKYHKCLSEMMRYILGQKGTPVKSVELFIEKLEKDTLLFTHFPIDLFVKKRNELALLESHTGAIKLRHQWHSKYQNGKSIPQMPFRLDFLPIFGDNEMFRPNLMPFRKALIELSLKYKWSHLTTTDKIIFNIETLSDKFLVANLKEMIRR